MLGKILLVDDEPSVLKTLSRCLSWESVEVLTATSATEGLELMAREEIDVVIADDRMPDMPGRELLALVANRYPETVRIMLTGYPSLDSAVEAINEGRVFRFLTKPWNEIELENALRDALCHRQILLRGRQQMIAEDMDAEELEALLYSAANSVGPNEIATAALDAGSRPDAEDNRLPNADQADQRGEKTAAERGQTPNP